ncbi:MAG: hypothetical protein K8R18_04930 [Parvibaculum sp.]|uniref:hypothetical protein n=1 Tax=Parvibaculum sp. TaxID=2024848 RepID=UPI0025CE8D96|nr:hypothetical protein [Parvibaculum sp.]MCE9648954.1 hypothetical protein [Parvibaculum sp.]
MRHISKMLLVAASLCIVSAAPATAEKRCAEGRTASGACVDPVLARLMRHQAIVMTQPKLSYTAPLVMPDDKDVVLPPRQIYETVQTLPRGRYTRP